MTTSSEDVLLLVNHVRHKKSDGTLYVMGERLAWIMNGKDTFSISHRYADIKIQKISPDGKSKVQLQVVLHDGGASTFHFTNPAGTEAQIQDRDSVKETLQQLLPRFKRKINKELEEKNKMLVEDPELFQLYCDLVTSQVITADEFWANHAPKQKGLPQTCQDVGVSGAFLAGIKPQSDGCNGLKYNLTADVIESIFKTYPAVKKKHLEYVPDKLSESEFWTRFFQSHYFHRDRLNSGLKDLFSECMKNDEQDIQSEIPRIVKDPLVDLTSFTDSTLDEGYGEGNAVQHTNAVNQNMIRRFNHHSMMVLKACEKSSASTPNSKNNTNFPNQTEPKDKIELFNKGATLLNGLTDHKLPADDELEGPASKKVKLQSKITYEDLENKQSAHAPILNLTRADRYFHGPTPVSNVDYVTNEELLHTIQILHQEVEPWKPNLPKVLSSNLAITGLGELSPGGALMKRACIENLHQSVPLHLQQELKHLYLALCELMRHFWSCFPVTNDQLEEKLVRMRGNLERFQYAKLMPFQDCLLRDHYNTNYTSFDVSERYMVVGASSGSLYVFQRDPLKFLQILPSKLGAAIQVCLAPDDNLVGYGTDKGVVAVVEHNIARKGNHSPQRLQISYDHKGAQILALCWNTNSSRLFAGDDRGRVSVVNLPTSKSKLLLQVPSVIIMRLDSKIVQLDYAQDKLVASTMTRSYLCNTTAEQYTQIGKNTREGEFGACFFNCNRVQTPSIYATRPGCKIWEIDYQGVVLNTQQFKDAFAISPHSITLLETKFLITWIEDAMFVFDPVNAEVILWSESIRGIRYLRCFKNDIYIWLLDGTFKHIALIPVEKFIQLLYHRPNWLLCAETIYHYESIILSSCSRRHVSVSMMKELVVYLIQNEKNNLATQLEIIINQLETETGSMSSSVSGRSSADSFSKQESGIYIVHPSSGYTSDSEDFRRLPRRHASYKSQLGTPRATSPFQSISPQRLHSTTRSPTLIPKCSSSVTSAHIPNGVDNIISERSKVVVKSPKSTTSHTSKKDKKNTAQNLPLSSSQASLPPSSKKISDVKLPPPTKKTSKMSQSYPAPNSQPFAPVSRRSPTASARKQTQQNISLTPSESQKVSIQERKNYSSLSSSTKREIVKSKVERTRSPRETSSKTGSQSPKQKHPSEEKLPEKQTAVKSVTSLKDLSCYTANREQTSCSIVTESKSSIELPDKSITATVTTLEIHKADDSISSSSITKSKELLKTPNKEESETKEKEGGKITLAFPYSTYLQYGLLESSFGDFGENCAIVTIPTPASLSDIRDTISSKLNSGKDIVRQTIEGIEEKLNFSKVDNNTFDLLDVNCKASKVKPPSLLIPEEPIVKNYKKEKVSVEQETFPLTMAFRKNLFSLSTSDITAFVNLSKDTLNKISATPNDPDHDLPSRRTLSEWLSELDDLQSQVMKGVKKQITNEIEDLKLNITFLCKIMQKSSDFPNQINSRLLSTVKNGNDSLPTNSIENISEFIVNNMIFVEDPFDIMKEDQNIIRNLIMLCFKWKIFSAVKVNDSKKLTEQNGNVAILPAVFSNVNEKQISSDDEETKKKQPNSRLKKSISFTHGFVSHLTEESYKRWLESVKKLSCVTYSDSSSSLDQEGAAFVRKYFHLLDLEEAHKMVLGWTNCCRCFSWLALVEGYAESKWDETLYQSFIEGKKLPEMKHLSSLNLLAVIKKLMETNPSIGIDACIHNNSFITPVDILFLCCLTTHPAHWFELYLNRMITSGTKGNIQPIFHMRSALNQLAVDDEIIMNWAAIILAKGDSMRDSLKCSCGYPCLWAHQISWPQSPLLWQLLKKKTPWHDHLALWCYLCGFWPGFLLHCKEENWFDLAMELIIQLGDIKLICSTLEYGFLPSNEDMWKQLLLTVARQQHCPELVSCLRCGLTLCKRSAVSSPSDQFLSNTSQSSVMTRSSEAAKLVMALDDQQESLNKPPSISWTSLTQLLLQQFPPSDAITLLKTVEDSMPPGSLSLEILKQLTLASVLRTQKRSSLFSKLPNGDNLSRYHERPKFLGPELYHLFQAEKRNLGSDSLTPVNELPSLSSPRFQEQSNCHWGIVLSLYDDCSICRLPLSLGTSSIIQGIIILKCGHAFHQGCLEKRSCCVCDTANK